MALCMVKNIPKPQMTKIKPQMTKIYYSKLTKLFWILESHLYHAYAWYKIYFLQKSYNKYLT